VSDSLVSENYITRWIYFPSRAEHVKLCLNLPRPRGKAKYSYITDSVLVPWGKGEKYPGRGVK